jgi:hypothetical protein
MVRPGYLVPAVPAATLKQVYGDRTPDPYVEHIALIIEYWIGSGATPSMTRNKVLEIARSGRIHSGNIRDLISLLAKRGFADEFFDLTRSSVDTGGALRGFLLSNGLTNDDIRQYASWNGIDPKLFLDGFFVGMAESAASVVVDLAQLAKLVIRMQQAQLRTLGLLVTDVEAGVQSLREQVAVVEQVFDALIEQLDPTRLPAKFVDTWKQWNRDFEKHLEELDPFSAGHLLGRIAGDLWQLLTGLVALVKLLRIAGRLALRYAPLLVGSVRRVAAEAGIVIRELATLMTAIGRPVFDGTAKVGLGVLRTLFPPKVLRQLVKDGRAFLMHHELSLFPVFEPAYAQAFGGAGMRSRFAVLVSGEEGRPVLMAAMSEKLPAAGGGIRQEAMASIDDTLDQLDDLFRGADAPQLPVSEAAARAAAQALLNQRLDTFLRKVLNEVAYAAFADLRKSRHRFFAPELGRLIHQRMAGRLAADVAQAAPGVTVRTEKKLRTLVKELSATDREMQASLQGAEKRCNETVAAMVARRLDVMEILGIEPKAAAQSEKAVAKILKDQFGWTPQTTIGDLQSDIILADTKVKTLINVDWTPSTLADRFERTWGKVVEDLGGRFSGDWDTVAEAYKKAFKGEVPDEVKSGLEALTRHAVRETIVRKVALEEIFGKLWNVSSHEMLYDGLGKMWRPRVSKAPAGKLP